MKTKLISSALGPVLLFAALAASAFAQEIPYSVEKFSNPPPPSASARDSEEKLKLEVAINPDNVDNWNNFGWRLYKDGLYAKCVWVMGEARKRSANDPYTLWLSGLACYAVGDNTDAKTYLWKLWTANKTWPATVDMGVTYDVLGRISLVQEGDLFQASYFLGKAEEELPKDWQIAFIHGISEWYRFHYGQSLDEFEKARALNPHNAIVLRSYAWAKLASDERDKDYTQQRKDADLFPDAAKDALQAAQIYQADVSVIRDAINADPGDSSNYQLLGSYYKSLDETDKALEAYRKAVAIDPNDASSKYKLADLLADLDTEASRKEAKQLLIQSIALSPGYWEEDREAPHVGLLNSILMEEGNVKEAQDLTDWLDGQNQVNE